MDLERFARDGAPMTPCIVVATDSFMFDGVVFCAAKWHPEDAKEMARTPEVATVFDHMGRIIHTNNVPMPPTEP